MELLCANRNWKSTQGYYSVRFFSLYCSVGDCDDARLEAMQKRFALRWTGPLHGNASNESIALIDCCYWRYKWNTHSAQLRAWFREQLGRYIRWRPASSHFGAFIFVFFFCFFPVVRIISLSALWKEYCDAYLLLAHSTFGNAIRLTSFDLIVG